MSSKSSWGFNRSGILYSAVKPWFTVVYRKMRSKAVTWDTIIFIFEFKGSAAELLGLFVFLIQIAWTRASSSAVPIAKWNT